jgi:radical SAM superfamily enzyme YgiQ (UPF0313 family)
VRVALGYPNRARLARSNLGFRIIERRLSERAGFDVERFFLPDDGPPLRGAALRTEPSGSKLASVDLVLLSIAYEGDAPHVPALLAAGGLPPRSSERSASHPLVVAGGAAVMINPEPLALFVDLFMVGEAEALLDPLLDRWAALRDAGRAEMLASLAKLPGAVVPLLRRHQLWSTGGATLRQGARVSLRGSARTLADLPEAEAGSPVETVKWTEAPQQVSAARLPADGAFPDALLLELGRGCPRHCRFCVACRIYAPLRQRSAPLLIDEARRGSVAGETVGLLSLSAGDHPGLAPLAQTLRDEGRRLTISSLPASFSRREVVRALLESGARTLTIAPETGSDRLRALIGKPISNDAILRSVELLGAEGLPQLRAYFMIGLPFEEDDDWRALALLLREMRRRLPPACRLSATVNPFVPMPRTPFQWAPMPPANRLREAGRRLRREAPRGVRVLVKSVRESREHAALVRGDAAWGERLLRMGGGGETMTAALRADGLRLDDLTGPVDPGACLPWAYLSDETETAALRGEWMLALDESGRRTDGGASGGAGPRP